MRPRRHRHIHRPPDLTSMFDVLFIVVFAALIRAAAVENAAAHPPAPPRPSAPVPPPAVAALRERALVDFSRDLAGRTPLVVRIAVDAQARAKIDALEVDGKRIALDVPLLELSRDPDAAVTYLGDRSADLRVCQIAAVRLGAPDLSRYLVIIAPALPLADLQHALFDGLHRDVDRCLTEQRGLAALIDPAALAPAATPQVRP
jgi:hypothetical protein